MFYVQLAVQWLMTVLDPTSSPANNSWLSLTPWAHRLMAHDCPWPYELTIKWLVTVLDSMSSPPNDSWLSLTLWCYSGTLYWNIIHWQGYQSHISITHLTTFCQNLMLADSLGWSISPPWNISYIGLFLTLIMPTSVTAGNIHNNIRTCACASIQCYNVRIFIAVL